MPHTINTHDNFRRGQFIFVLRNLDWNICRPVEVAKCFWGWSDGDQSADCRRNCPSSEKVRPDVCFSADRKSYMIIREETDGSSKNFSQGSLSKIQHDRQRIKNEDLVIIISVQVKSLWTRKSQCKRSIETKTANSSFSSILHAILHRWNVQRRMQAVHSVELHVVWRGLLLGLQSVRKTSVNHLHLCICTDVLFCHYLQAIPSLQLLLYIQ